MSEEEVLDEVAEDSEALDEELWTQEDEVEGESTEEGTPKAEAEETEAKEPESEDDETEDEEEPEEPQHDYESRYKDLEREFHKRNEDSARLRQDFDELRLKGVEREQSLQRVKDGLSETEAPLLIQLMRILSLIRQIKTQWRSSLNYLLRSAK